MNYRELQLRQIIKNSYVPLNTHKQKVRELKKAGVQDLINTLQKGLGINLFSDYSIIVEKLKLTGRTVGEVLTDNERLAKRVELLEKYLIRPRSEQETQTDLSEEQIQHLQGSIAYYSATVPNLEKELVELREKDNDNQQQIRALKLDKEDLLKLVSEKESELLETENNQQDKENNSSPLSHKEKRKLKKQSK